MAKSMFIWKKKDLGIYIHIPFCVRKCLYCDFLSFNQEYFRDNQRGFAHQSETKSGTGSEAERPVKIYTGKSIIREYADALSEEIRQAPFKYGFDSSEYKVRTVYIGGGTPSSIDVVYIIQILRKLYDCFDIENPNEAEITLEANPGTLTTEKLKTYRGAGVNRLSLGLQSASDKELKLLGRIHTYSDFLKSYELSREAGFENINVDIMTAIPGQDMDSLNDSLCKLVKLNPEHISAYSLILEEGTPFYSMYHRAEENVERQMYWFVRDKLKKHGYESYEISNFARKGFESRHNTAYWKRIPYLGLGLGASSLIYETRYKNTADMDSYLRCPEDPSQFEEKMNLSEKERMEEMMFLGLRMSEGVRKADFIDTFGVCVDDIYKKELKKLSKDGLIIDSEESICLTDKGVDYGNYVFSRFLLD